MSDINTPPPPRDDRVVHNTTINTTERRGGGGPWVALAVIVLLVVAGLIGWAVYTGQTPVAEPSEVNVDVDLPRPELPDAPRLPENPLPVVDRRIQPPHATEQRFDFPEEQCPARRERLVEARHDRRRGARGREDRPPRLGPQSREAGLGGRRNPRERR